MTRSNAEITSQLKVWVVTPLDGVAAQVTCPHCSETATLNLATWASALVTEKDVLIIGRPCPYCFKTSRLPGEEG